MRPDIRRGQALRPAGHDLADEGCGIFGGENRVRDLRQPVRRQLGMCREHGNAMVETGERRSALVRNAIRKGKKRDRCLVERCRNLFRGHIQPQPDGVAFGGAFHQADKGGIVVDHRSDHLRLDGRLRRPQPRHRFEKEFNALVARDLAEVDQPFRLRCRTARRPLGDVVADRDDGQPRFGMREIALEQRSLFVI